MANSEIIRRLTRAMRAADVAFEQSGGSTRDYVRDNLLPILAEFKLEIRLLNSNADAALGLCE